MGPDDLAIGLALSDRGSDGWIFFRQAGTGSSGPLPDGSVRVTRDEAAKTTRYELALPFSLTGIQPGASPEIGVALLLNDYSPGGSTPVRAEFGKGADGIPRPGLHARLRLPAPPVPVVTARIVRPVEWSVSEPAEILVAAGGPAPLTISAVFPGSESLRIGIPGGGDIRRHRIQAGGAAEDAAPLEVRVEAAQTGRAGSPPLLELRAPVTRPGARWAAFESRIAELLAADGIHPLFAHHLRSMQAVAGSEWARMGLYRHSNPLLAEKTLGRIADWTEALHGEAGEWAA